MGLDRVRILSTGFSGATGYTNMYFTSATTANLNAVRALFDALKAYLPTVVRFTFPSAGDTIDETDGHLLGGWSGVAPADVVGTASGVYPAPCGFMLQWKTNGVVDGHRPIAKTFFVPMGTIGLSATGGISATLVTAANAAITTFLGTSAGFSLWHRPIAAKAGPPPVAARPGGAFPISSGQCSPKTVVLRSRRD
jgi:hypothetical protein